MCELFSCGNLRDVRTFSHTNESRQMPRFLLLLTFVVVSACASDPRSPIPQSLADREEQIRRVEEIKQGGVL
jgi:hypothetical protein